MHEGTKEWEQGKTSNTFVYKGWDKMPTFSLPFGANTDIAAVLKTGKNMCSTNQPRAFFITLGIIKSNNSKYVIFHQIKDFYTVTSAIKVF